MGKYALLIGVGEYGEGLQLLPAAPNDVAALAEVLRNPQMGGFDDVKPVVNPTRGEMEREIELWFQGRNPDDLVLLFFSGHGLKDDRRDLYFAARNTEKQKNRLIRSTATSARFIHDCIQSCKAKHQVLVLDCCFSGAFGDVLVKDDSSVGLKEQLGAEGRVVLTSTSAVDYSFAEKETGLSIYTRYLVEGIASGAADEDKDGVITVDEIHRYAGSKIAETSLSMSPKIITLKDEGYRIQLARSPQDNPKLKYRKEVERIATAGRFSIPARQLLIALRRDFDISDADAQAIEAEVLKPYQEYQRKRKEYEDTLRQSLQAEPILSSHTIQDLIDFRNHLRLKPADIASIECNELNGYNLESYVEEIEWRRKAAETDQRRQTEETKHRQQAQDEAERQQKTAAEADPAQQRQAVEAKQKRQEEIEQQGKKAEAQQTQQLAANEDDLSSERFGTNYYAKLRDLLAAKNWKAADRETASCMCKVMDRQGEGYLRIEDLEIFPCLDLWNINTLWVTYSQGQFGFSVQKEIWQSCGSPTEYNKKDWAKFGTQVGWKTRGVLGLGCEWKLYGVLTFDLTAPKGHLPTGACSVLRQRGAEIWRAWVLFRGVWFSSLASRCMDCKIQ